MNSVVAMLVAFARCPIVKGQARERALDLLWRMDRKAWSFALLGSAETPF